jgi:hypothetical protein
MDKEVQILNSLAGKLKAQEISKLLKVSTRTIYELKRDMPLFGGLLKDKRLFLKRGCRKPVQKPEMET